jgi:hypothetical protein
VFLVLRWREIGSQPVTPVDVVESSPILTASIPSKDMVCLDASDVVELLCRPAFRLAKLNRVGG